MDEYRQELKIMFQCYFVDVENQRCQERQEDYWCSDDHKVRWQEKEYGTEGRKKGKLTIKEIQERLLQMGKEQK